MKEILGVITGMLLGCLAMGIGFALCIAPAVWVIWAVFR